jgi:TonB family protein
MPRSVSNEWGQQVAGYVLVAYVVSAGGLVADPVVLKSSEPRLERAALDAMGGWRFKPGRLKGRAVATTAAQEFSFGPEDPANGYRTVRVATYQPTDVLIRRTPPAEAFKGYLGLVRQTAHNFFVDASRPETFHIVGVAQPGGRVRIWFVSSRRSGVAPELEPLRTLLQAIPLQVHGGPLAFAVSGTVAGGDRSEPLEGPAYRNPIPAEWREAERRLAHPLPMSSDAFLDAVFPP